MKPHPFLFLFPLSFLAAGICGAEAAEAAPSPLAPAAAQLAQLVESFVARDEIVGAELLVVHRGQPVLHRAFGFQDREAKRPMQPNTFFAIRSMTKPFTGMAAQLLIDEGRLDLDAPVANYLPSFANEKSRAITVRHLLTHRSGLPLHFLGEQAKPLGEYSGLRELADLAGGRGPDFAPGTRFLYSDAGSDALGAVVAEVAKQSLEHFVQERILEPLGLRETFPERQAGEAAHRDRTATRYAGMEGSWSRYWGPSDPPIYPFLKGSGGLFATPRDYARFLQFWLEGKTSGGQSLLSPAAFERALTAASRDASTTGLAEAVSDYGQMWMLFRPRAGEPRVFAFGHSGSDGTLALAFPEQELVVCYFTQSRGNATLRTFEEALGHLFVKPDAAAFARLVRPPAAGNFADFLGLYARDQRSNSVGAIIALDGRLAFELANRQVMLLRPTEDPDRWIPERAPNDSIAFRREDGRVVGFTLNNRGNAVEASRFQPAPDLPTPDELMALRSRAVPPAQLAALFPVRIVASIETQGRALPMTLTIDREGRSLQELDLGETSVMRTWIVGDRVWRQMPGASAAPVELVGLERSQELDGSLAATMSDWRRTYASVVVLGREQFGGREVFRVRTVPRAGLASTKLVSAETGGVVAEYAIVFVPGAGLQPAESQHSDLREVDGVEFSFAQAMQIGGTAGTRMRIATARIEVRAEVDEALFEPVAANVTPR